MQVKITESSSIDNLTDKELLAKYKKFKDKPEYQKQVDELISEIDKRGLAESTEEL